MCKTLRLTELLPDPWVDEYKGDHPSDGDYTTLIRGENINVLRPDGSPLLLLRHRAISPEICDRAFPALCRAARPTYNRGTAAGGKRVRRLKLDGTQSRTLTAMKVESGTIGFFDRTSRIPYCRTTAYTYRDRAGWYAVLPFVRAANEVFRREAPEQYSVQEEAARRTPSDWVIPGTAFTTITVNRNWPTTIHKDKGDLPGGFGVISVLRRGEYEGCRLVFPKYCIAVELGTGDVLLADVHEWHGNTPMTGISESYDRISTVLYFREKMQNCASAEEELHRVKNRKPGDRLG